MKKRLLALILAMVMLISSAACSASTDNADKAADAVMNDNSKTDNTSVEDEEETEENSIVMDDLEPSDFGGIDYIVIGHSDRTTTAVTSSEINGEIVNDAQYNSARTVEDRFSVRISYEDIAPGDSGLTTSVQGMVNGGEDQYAVAVATDTPQITLALAGFYYNLKSIEQFNFDMPWWTESTDQISIGNKAYVASNYLTYYCLYYMRIFVINKLIANELGIEVPYQKVYEGTWYLDTLGEMCEKAVLDLNGDGILDKNDQFGLSYGALYTLQNSFDINIVSKDADNMPYINLDVDRAAIYLDKMWNIIDNYGFYENGYGATFFSNGQSLMCYCNLREVCNIIRDTDLDYGFLPTPKLDELQENYKSVGTDIYWGIPSSHSAKLDMIGTVTEALTCQHFNYVRPAFFETTMKSKLSGSEDDTNMLDIASSNLSLDFGFSYKDNISGMASLFDLIDCKVTSDKLASSYQKISKAMSKSLDKIISAYDNLP